MFGDYYAYDKWHQNTISATNTNNVQGQQGFWFRRIYFTYDLTFSEKFTTRFRLEANSNGQFTNPGNITPFIKDAYLKWTFWNKQVLTSVSSPASPSTGTRGSRACATSRRRPSDLYRIDSSRDFGVSVGGPILAIKNLTYGVQYGNELGQRLGDDKYKIWRLEARYDKNPGIAVEGYYSHHERPGGQDRDDGTGVVGLPQRKSPCSPVSYHYQKRKRASRAGLDQDDRHLVRPGATGSSRPRRADVFFRYDDVKGKLGPVDTGLPGADGIDYWIMSTQAALQELHLRRRVVDPPVGPLQPEHRDGEVRQRSPIRRTSPAATRTRSTASRSSGPGERGFNAGLTRAKRPVHRGRGY